MKLLFVIKTMNSGGGGAERLLAQVTEEMANRGHEVTLLSFDNPEAPDFYAIDPRIRRVWLDAGRNRGRTRLIDFAKRVFALRRVLPALAPDVAVGFMHSAYLPLGAALVRSGIPVIASEHCVFSHYSGDLKDRLALSLSVPLFKCFTVVSEQAKASFPVRFRRKMVVIPNAPVSGSASRPASPSTSTRILGVGRLAREKNHATLIAAFARVAGLHSDWTLRIVGDGELRADLEAQAARLGLADRVAFPGAVGDIWPEYEAAAIFAVPSTYESFGLATAEALSAGLPAVGFADCVGTNELIEDGVNGVLVDSSDRVAGLAEALDRLMKSPHLRERMADAAPKSVRQLTADEAVSGWDHLFETLVGLPTNRREGRAGKGSN